MTTLVIKDSDTNKPYELTRRDFLINNGIILKVAKSERTFKHSFFKTIQDNREAILAHVEEHYPEILI